MIPSARSAPAQGGASRTVAQYLELVRRHRLRFLGCLLLGAALGALATVTQPSSYRATASVLVTPTGVTDPNPARNRAPGGIDLDTEIQLITSTPVIRQAARTLSRPASRVAEGLFVSVPPNSRVLHVTFTDRQTGRAAAGANAVANAYLDQREAYANTLLAGKIKRRQAKVDDVQASLSTAAGSATAATSTQKLLYYQSQVQVLVRQLRRAQASVLALRSTAVTPGQVLLPAARPAISTKLHRPRHLLEGVLLGLAAGLLSVHAGRGRTARITGVGDLRDSVPHSTPVLELGGDRPGLAEADLAGIVFSRRPVGSVVLATSPRVPTDVRWVRELSQGLTRAGQQAVVLHWDPAGTGASHAAGRALSAINGFVRIDAAGNRVVGFPDDELYRLGTAPRSVVAALIDQLRADYDFIVIADPGPRAHRSVIASLADGAVLMAVRNRTTVSDLAEAVLAIGPEKVLCAVLVPTRASRADAAHGLPPQVPALSVG